ncbi:MAG: YkvA family protein [Cytophagaceae bacterium]
MNKLFAIGKALFSKDSQNYDLYKRALNRFYDTENNALKFEKLQNDFSLFFRMLKAVAKREYTGVSFTLPVRMILAGAFFYFNLDFVPDDIPVIGVADDVAVLLWVIDGIRIEMEKFEAWEAGMSVETA